MSNTTKDQDDLHLASAAAAPSWWDKFKLLVDDLVGEYSDDSDTEKDADKKDSKDEEDKKDADKKDEEEKELTAKEIEEMEATAADGVQSGGAEFTVITYGRFSDVTDQPQLIVLITSPIGRPHFQIFPIEFIPDFGVAPSAIDDGPFSVFERGLPEFGLPSRIGSNNDPNQSAGNKLFPDNITVSGNLLDNDSLGDPAAFIAFVELDGGFYFPNVNGVITVPTAIGDMTVYTQSFMGFAPGDFSYTLDANAIHPWGDGINSIIQDFTYTIVNTEGASSAAFPVVVWDDIPTGYNDYYEVIKPPIPAYDILVVLDTSLSMLIPGFNGGGDSRLEIMKEALTGDGGILDGYDNAASDLNINIINFAFFPNFYAAADVIDAKTHIDGLGVGLLTNYNLALLASEISLVANALNPAVQGYEKQVIFMSDGAPLGGYIPPGLLTTAAWQATLALLNVDTDVIRVATPLPTSFLHLLPIARLGSFPEYLDGDLSNVSDFFPPIIPDLAQITGNVFDNDVLGADGLLDHLGPNGELGLYKIELMFESEAAALQYIADNPGLGATSVGGIVTVPIPNGSIPTVLGQTLEIDNQGNFIYTINSSSKDAASDFFIYHYLDNDGDPSYAVVELQTYIEPIPRDDCNKVFEAGLEPHGNLAGFLPTIATGNIFVNDTLGTDPELVKFNYMGTDYAPGDVVVTPEWKMIILADGSYVFSLGQPLTVPGHGPNVVLADFTYTVTNITGVENDAVLTIKIVDDIPVAVPDLPRSVVEGENVISGNVMANDLQGADQPVYLNSFTYKDSLLGTDTVVIPFGGNVSVETYLGGTLSVNYDGAWKYRSPDWVLNPFGLPLPDGFEYTIIDNDLDTSSAIQAIFVEDGPLQAFNDGFDSPIEVFESALPDGSDPGGAALMVSGNVLLNDTLGTDPGAFPNPITHVTYDGTDYDAHLIFGNIDIVTPEFTFHMDSRDGFFGKTAGDFEFTLTDNMMHPAVQGPNPLDHIFTYHYQDIDGTMTQADLRIRVIDDVPVAVADAYQIDIPAPVETAYSLIFMIDTHYKTNFFGGGSTANQNAMKASTNALIDAYAALSGDLNIQIIDFDTSANLSMVFTDPNAAKAHVNGVPLSGNFFHEAVDYNEAITDGGDGAVTAMGNVQEDINVIYLMTDGRTSTFFGLFPTDPSGGSISAWDNAVAANSYTAYISRFGNNPDPDNVLSGLDNSGLYNSLAPLSNTWMNHLPSGGGGPQEASITDNILANDTPGADNPLLLHELTFDVLSLTFPSPDTLYLILFPLGGILEIHANGDFTFTVDSNSQARTENFTYTTIDTDGDISNVATFDIQIDGPAAPAAPLALGAPAIPDPYIELHLVGSEHNDHHLSTSGHPVDVVHMKATEAPTEFVIDMDDVDPPDTVVIENLGTAQENILTFDDVIDIDNDNDTDIDDVVQSFSQAAPDAPVEVSLHNNTTLVLHDIGTVAGSDVQSLEQHLQQVTEQVNVQP